MRLNQSDRLSFRIFLVVPMLLVVATAAQAEFVTDVIVSDAFTRSDGGTATDSIGDAESPAGTYHWYEGYLIWDYSGDAGAIQSGKVLLHSAGGARQITLNTDFVNLTTATDVTFVLGTGATPAANATMFLRKNTVLGGGLFWDETGLIMIEFSPTGFLMVREFTAGAGTTLYAENPWTGSTTDAFGAGGSLPALVNGLAFDDDQDGRIGAAATLETITLGADLRGTALSVSINGEVFFAGSVAATGSPTGDNYFALAYNALGGSCTVLTYFDDVNLTHLVPPRGTLVVIE